MTKPREADLFAAFTILLCATIAYLGRNVLNPDGVSYLDLTDALRRGDWTHFVQGYWSPLYPLLIGITSFITGVEGAGLPVLAHWINAGAAVMAAVVLWNWARQVPNPFFARASFAALLLCSAGPPRIEAVTPDVLLLGLAAWISYEMLFHHGNRSLRLGVLLGLAFLAKSSCWPWLIALFAARLWAARDPIARRSVVRSTLVAAAVMGLWIVPLSLKEGRPSVSSSSSLNYCWYIEGCDGRTPDTHAGQHRSYHDVRVTDSLHLTWASFDEAEGATYQPWSDPTAWQQGVESQRRVDLPFSKALSYRLELARLTFALWELPLILGVLVPMVWLGRRRGMWRELRTTNRLAAAVMISGLAGLGEFVLIHVEPRLIAPFALIAAMAVLSWSTAIPVPPDAKPDHTRHAHKRTPSWVPQVLASVGLIAALYFSWQVLQEGTATNTRTQEAIRTIRAVDVGFARRGFSERRIVIIGPAIPVIGSAYWLGSHITAQMLPRSAAALGALPDADRRRLIDSLFANRAEVAWITSEEGGIRIVPLFRPSPPTP